MAVAIGAVLVLRRGPPALPPPPPSGVDRFGDPLPPWAVARIGTVRRAVAHAGLAYSADGAELLCGGDDGVLRRFDATSGVLRREDRLRSGFVTGERPRNSFSWLTDAFDRRPEQVHADLPWQMAFSADGTRTVCAGTESVSLHTPQETFRRRRAGQQPNAVAITRDGAKFAVGWIDGTIEVGESGVTLGRVGPNVQSLAFSPDGTLLAVRAQGVTVFDTTNGSVLATLPLDPRYEPSGLAFSPDGVHLALMSGRDGLALCDARTLALRWETKDPGRMNFGDVGFSPDGRTIAWGTNAVSLVDAASGKILRAIETPAFTGVRVAWSPDSRRVAAIVGNVVRSWCAASGAEIAPAPPPSMEVHGVAFSPDGRTLLTRGMGNSIDFWDAATGALLRSLPITGWASDADFAPDASSVLAVTRVKGAISLVRLDATTGASLEALAIPGLPTFLLRGERPRLLRVQRTPPISWDLADPRTGAVLVTLKGPPVEGARAVSDDGRLLVALASKPALVTMELSTGERTETDVRWPESDGIGQYIAISRDASLVAIGLEHGRVLVVDRISGRRRFDVDSGLHGATIAMALSPDGSLLALGDPWGDVRLWSVEREAPLVTFHGHRGWVQALAFSPDGTRLVSGSHDATALVWDVSGFKPRADEAK